MGGKVVDKQSRRREGFRNETQSQKSSVRGGGVLSVTFFKNIFKY